MELRGVNRFSIKFVLKLKLKLKLKLESSVISF